MKKSAFTLVEILIVVILFGLLSGIILKTYTTITKVAFRIEQDKELAKETLVLSQVLQNIAAEATIDYSQYHDLKNTNGITDTLYLTGGQRTGTQLFSTWNCENARNLYDEKYRENKDQNTDFSSCKLMLQKGDQEFALLGIGKFLQSRMQFKVIPYVSALESLGSWATAAKPWFWILGAVYSPFYDPQKRSNSSILPIQLFFGLQGATPNLYELKETSDED
mgnify:FL=1